MISGAKRRGESQGALPLLGIVLMIAAILVMLLALLRPAWADAPKPVPTVEQLQAENESLKAQIAQLQQMYAYDNRVCSGALQAAREFAIGKPQQVPKEASKSKP